MIWKRCFVCKGKGHVLSHSQVRELKERKCTDRKGKVDYGCVEKHLTQPNAVCELCEGEGRLGYYYRGE